MLIITKENNSIKVVGQNNPTYPYSGTLVYPLNSVTVVTDQSNMAVFRSALNNDVLFTGLIDDITIAGSAVTKEDIGTKFGAIANSSSSGGGGTGGGAVDSVNGQTGTVVLTANDVNAYAKNEVDGLLSAKVGVDVYNRDIPTLATKNELAGEVSEREKQDSALGGMIAGETEAREQAITNLTATVQGKLDTATYNAEKAAFETKEHAAATYQPKGDYASETLVNNLEGMVTDLQDYYDRLNDETHRLDDAKQDKLVSGTNIKTINSQSLLGEGNIEITVEGGGITDAPNDGKLYGRKSEQWTEVVIPDTSNLATKAELGTKLDTSTYNEEKATFALKTEIPDTSTLATKTELSEGLAGKANTSDLSDYLTTANAQSTYATKSELGAKLDVETYNEEKATFALKSELPDTSDFVTKATADETYQPKGEYLTDADLTDYLTKDDASNTYREKKIINFNRTNTSNEITNAWANSLNNIGATFQYVSFDEGATYNNVLYCGYRSYNGAGNRKGVGITEIDGKMRSVIFEFSGTNCVATLEDEIDLNNYATTEQLNGKQDTLVSGTNIKTINGNTILGEGNIQIETTGGGITDAPSDDKTYGRKNGDWSEITEPDLSNYALKSEVPKQYVQDISFVAPSSINIFDQDGNPKIIGFADGITLGEKGENVEVKLSDSFVNKVNAKQDTLVSGTNIKTVNGNSLLGSGDITIEGGGTSYTAGEGIDISEANVISVDNSALNIPTRQTGEEGTTNNYIYSNSGSTSYRAISYATIGTVNKKLYLRGRYWGMPDSTSINLSVSAIPEASSNSNGLLSIADKSKLDTLQTEWFGTQSQFDGLESKDENTLYFITEE